jgi:hypothetical protein
MRNEIWRAENLLYQINEDEKTCKIIGKHATCTDRDIVIPKILDGYRVTEIMMPGYDDFGFGDKITSVLLPDSVTRIGDRAFCGCSFMTEAEIADSVTYIGKDAFADCERLITMKIPKFTVSISSGAFANCANLDSIEIPDSVMSIDEKAFWYCTGLTSVKISGSVTTIGKNAFCGCSHLKTLSIPLSVTKIENSALAGVGKIDVPADHPTYASVDGHLYSKDRRTFIHYDVTKKSGYFALPEVVNVIEESAFAQCESLASVSLPETITHIGGSAFSGCSNLTSVSYAGSKRGWKKIKADKYWKENSVIYEVNCKNGLIKIK